MLSILVFEEEESSNERGIWRSKYRLVSMLCLVSSVKDCRFYFEILYFFCVYVFVFVGLLDLELNR